MMSCWIVAGYMAYAGIYYTYTPISILDGRISYRKGARKLGHSGRYICTGTMLSFVFFLPYLVSGDSFSGADFFGVWFSGREVFG